MQIRAGEGDYTKTLNISTRCGQDSDCNPASAGGILGTMLGYSNIPEEVTYFMTRIEDYNLPFFGMVVMNFIFPLLILMNSDYKRINYFIVMAGIVIILGHYMDVFNMIMPSAVGDQWFIGAAEIGGFLFFLGLFIFVVFKELTKAPLLAKGDPYMGESERFHY